MAKKINQSEVSSLFSSIDESMTKKVLNKVKDIVMITKPNGTIVYVNPSLEEITGYRQAEFIGKRPWIVYPEDSEKCKKFFKSSFRVSGEIKHRILTKDNKVKWVIHSCCSIKENGRVVSILSILKDITDIKNSQDEANRNGQELDLILDSSPTIVFYKDMKGRFMQVNSAFAKALNVTKGELLGKTVFDIYPSNIAKKMADDDIEVFRDEKAKLDIEEPYKSPTGIRWIKTNKIPTLDKDGKVTGIVGFSEDITERKKAEESLKYKNELLDLIQDSCHFGVWDWDIRKSIFFWSKEFLNIFGMPEITKPCLETWKKVIHPDDRKLAIRRIKDSLKNKDGHLSIYRIIMPDKSVRWIRASGRVFCDKNGPYRMTGVCIDITEERNYEHAIEQSQKKYKDLFNNMSSGVFVYQAVDNGKDFIIKDCNKSAEKIEGINRERVTGKSISKIFPSVKEFGILKVMQRVFKTGKPEHIPAKVYKDNRIEGWRENFIYRLESGEIVAVYDDVTCEMQDQDELKRVKNEQQIILDAVPALIFYKDKNNRFIRVNKYFYNSIGKTKEQLEGKSMSEVFPNDQALKFWNDDKEIIRTGKSKLNIIETAQTKAGEKTFHTDKIPFRDKNGNVIGIIGFSSDITDDINRQREMYKLNDELQLRVSQLEKFNKLSVGRELKMIELKKKIKELGVSKNG
jgi:PAS domain S-box-containing protein